MPYGYDKTRTERRCKDCNKLLYVFEVGEFCIECSRKKGKDLIITFTNRMNDEKNMPEPEIPQKKTISYAS